ncbi:MAG: hypothetical protein HYX75_06630 [Acidobacteria bacterium]|nr:hypothetical protein [Acidobacteriota bacterium]
MRTCQKCGKTMPDNMNVCPGCGALQESGAPPEVTTNIKKSDVAAPNLLPEQPKHAGGAGKKLLLLVVLLVIVAGAVVGLLYLKGKRGAFPGISKTGGTAEQNAEFANLQQMADSIENLEKDIQKKGQDMARLQMEYEQQGGKLPTKGVAMTEEERKLLADLLKNEKGTYNDLLKEILAKDKEVWDLKEKLTQIEQQMPKPHVAKDGERHRDISIEYLMTTANLSKKDAAALVDQVNLLDPLLPGFKVWNFYLNGAFGTYVTQGTAEISPNQAERQKIQAIVDERNSAFAERDNLKVQVADLETQRTDLTGQVAGLNQEKETLTTEVGELKQVQSGLESDLNSLYYRAGPKKELQDLGIIKDPFLGGVRLDNFSSSDFTGKIDLRTTMNIVVTAEEFGMKKIKKAKILPEKTYKEDEDYRVGIPKEGLEATIEILNPDKFKLGKIVIALE